MSLTFPVYKSRSFWCANICAYATAVVDTIVLSVFELAEHVLDFPSIQIWELLVCYLCLLLCVHWCSCVFPFAIPVHVPFTWHAVFLS